MQLQLEKTLQINEAAGSNILAEVIWPCYQYRTKYRGKIRSEEIYSIIRTPYVEAFLSSEKNLFGHEEIFFTY